jgi:uncharacterized protein (DUF2235 family)
MSKNIVVCCDGTGNEFGEGNSNVVKLCQIMARDRKDQLVFYHPGVGTTPVPDRHRTLRNTWFKIKGLAFAAGITSNICEGYSYLMNTFEEGDRVFFFGFSRGAFTARAIAGMIHQVGLLTKRNQPMVQYAYKLYREHFDPAVLGKFRSTYSRKCQPHFMGLWDTVGSVGWAWDRENFAATYQNPDVSIVRHAIAIDERRAKFRTNKWGPPADGQDVRQVWFAGVHSDIGGGYPEMESGLSKIPLQWMVAEACAAGLHVYEDSYTKVVLGGNGKYARPDARGKMHDSLTGAWKFMEYIPLPSWNYEADKEELIQYREHPRQIAANSILHQSVIDRRSSDDSYGPTNIPEQYQVEPYSQTPSTLLKRDTLSK